MDVHRDRDMGSWESRARGREPGVLPHPLHPCKHSQWQLLVSAAQVMSARSSREVIITN